MVRCALYWEVTTLLRAPQKTPNHLTKVRCTPSDLCTPAHARQMKTPYGTDAQVGFLAGQSKQTWSTEITSY